MQPLEQKIHYKFRNSLLLAEALTHPSLAYETQRPHFDNQRLEFLGDAVLQLVLTEYLFTNYPSFSEGGMTKLRARLVSREALCKFALSLDLGEYVMMGKGEEASGGRTRPSTLADAFESLLGAVYLDGGFESARNVVLKITNDELQHIAEVPVEKNPKGQLQELLQSLAPESPIYNIISEDGPDHCKLFVSEVSWCGKMLASGEGNSKKEAETDAAKNALEKKLWES